MHKQSKRPYCIICYERLFAEYCDSCALPIGVDDGMDFDIEK